MKRGFRAAWLAPLAVLLATAAHAEQHQSRTYFGPPGAGPYGPTAPAVNNVWTARFFGIKCCKTPEDRYQKFQRKYAIIQARYQIEMDRLNWNAYYAYLNPANQGCGPTGCNCNAGGCGHRQSGGLFGHAKDCGDGCPHCGGDCYSCGKCKLCGLFNHKKHGKCGSGGPGGPYPYPGGAYGGYPGMNREDALRYIEGFQYYPPYQLIRSPRDFYMFDVKYGIGR